ncbi:nitroreductase family protein [Burkholderia sp. WAC0059]|uniref:nitroreductase n=1 Tax=Burkholderia sp. WAC0059 TaxID=2066022 RepID=UPI000C7E9C31|nr:nitroreductase [Burkholderia sp. WAC0059]PLZ04354.1 nitroreductase family protein [Burkholderia sp. WAC0059]
MKVSEAVRSRKSVRQFLPDPVSPALIREVLEAAARAPSGGNLQPWYLHVVGGEALAGLKSVVAKRLADAPDGERARHDVYPPNLASPYRERRFQVGEDLYRSIGIDRGDKAGRLRQFARNFVFFDAPLALFCSVDRRMGPPQWADLGMYLQTAMLLLREAGLHSCAQECWVRYAQTVGDFLALPPERMLYTGMAIGYEDPRAPINQWRSARAPLDEFAQFVGI